MSSYTLGKRVAGISLDGVSWCELPITGYEHIEDRKAAIPYTKVDVSHDFEVSLTIQAEQVIAAIEEMTAALMHLGLIAAYPILSPERLAEAQIDTPTPIDLLAELSEFTPLPDDFPVCDFGRRAYIASQLAGTFPYSFEEIMPLVDITQDETLIRSVLGDYVGQQDGLARARETLLAMRADNGD
jgi:hypothetical protein